MVFMENVQSPLQQAEEVLKFYFIVLKQRKVMYFFFLLNFAKLGSFSLIREWYNGKEFLKLYWKLGLLDSAWRKRVFQSIKLTLSSITPDKLS